VISLPNSGLLPTRGCASAPTRSRSPLVRRAGVAPRWAVRCPAGRKDPCGRGRCQPSLTPVWRQVNLASYSAHNPIDDGSAHQGDIATMKAAIRAILQAKPDDRPGMLARHGEQRAAAPATKLERKLEESRPHILFNVALELCEQLRDEWVAMGVEPIEAIAIAWVVVAAARLKTLPKTWGGDGAGIANYFTRDNPPLQPKLWVSELGEGLMVAQLVNKCATSLWLHIYAGYAKNLS
jgi:hypothetical protein